MSQPGHHLVQLFIVHMIIAQLIMGPLVKGMVKIDAREEKKLPAATNKVKQQDSQLQRD